MKEKVTKILKEYSQEHLLDYMKCLNKEEQEKLEKQILNIDFKQLKELYERIKQNQDLESKIIEHIKYTDKEKL